MSRVGAVAGDDQHLLPVAGIAAAAGLQMAAVALELVGPLQQPGGGFGEIRAALQPGLFGGSEVSQAGEPFKGSRARRSVAAQLQHRQRFIEGGMEGAFAQVVG